MAVEDDEKELDRLLAITAITPDEYSDLKSWLRRGASSSQTEAIKLIADWCKWCTTIETAMIAAIGAFLNSGKGGLSLWVQLPCVVAIACFVLSISLSAAVFSSLPEAIQHINPGQSVWTRKAYIFGQEWPMGRLTLNQLALFLLGILFFAVAAGAAAWAPPR